MPRLEHANLNVQDAEAITRFITAAFPEYHVRGSGASGPSGRPWRHVGDDQHYLALTEVSETTGRTPYDSQTGLNHLGFEIDDVDALENRLRGAGFEPNLRDDSHPARRRIYYFDPEGNDWEFVQYLSRDAAERNDYSR
jgi:catechol 2,3-dioxygenase-like lactoylglutathione lyase family enzyme